MEAFLTLEAYVLKSIINCWQLADPVPVSGRILQQFCSPRSWFAKCGWWPVLCCANQNKDGTTHNYLSFTNGRSVPNEKMGSVPFTVLELPLEAASVAHGSHLHLSLSLSFFFSVFSRIKHFQETTGQEVREEGISSWEVWFPQVKSCGGSIQEALLAHGDHCALWAPCVQSIWDSQSGAGQDSISFQHIPIRWTPAWNWEVAKNCVHQFITHRHQT